MGTGRATFELYPLGIVWCWRALAQFASGIEGLNRS